ncbi:MAG: hypothetical protein MUD17_14090, partial [Gemmatimonadaceae bacterium]|nr:hypothetical protein [Gemmatimonadaceae bacterium]
MFANSNPNVTLFDPNFAAQRSLRANLQWAGAVLRNRFRASVDVTYSRNLAQQSNFDLNFPAQSQFALANEGGRPVFVTPSSIVPTTGQTAWREARVVDAFGRVTMQRSDLTSESKQVTVSVSPIAFNSKFQWGLNYVISDVREQFYGFQSTVGDPTQREWARGNFSRHQIQYNLSREFFERVTLRWSGNIRSGTPYTPLISGDVNGDSYGNDRAFIFDPASAGDAALSSGLSALLATGTREARACLESQLGQLAGRNSCIGPWTTSANLSISLNSVRLGLPQRANVSLQVA